MNKLLSLGIIVFFISACSHENPSAPGAKDSSGGSGTVTSQQRNPSAGGPFALSLIPTEATRNSILHLVLTGFDISGAKIEWLVNGTPFTTLAPDQFNGADAAKGLTVQARAIVQGQTVLSNLVQIANSPPEITKVKIMPDVFRAGDTLSVDVEGSDIDGDGVTFLYEWTRNGESAGTGKSIGAVIKRGDKIAVTITPFDGEAYGKPLTLQREIKNLPPMITENTVFSFDGTIYTYQVKATDPDGDALTYSLVSPPAGMTIDSATGLLKWTVPPDFKSIKDISVLVNDGNGGTAQYDLKITIK